MCAVVLMHWTSIKIKEKVHYVVKSTAQIRYTAIYQIHRSHKQPFLCVYIHFAKLIPRRFLKQAVCKYPTTVNNSEYTFCCQSLALECDTSCVEIM